MNLTRRRLSFVQFLSNMLRWTLAIFLLSAFPATASINIDVDAVQKSVVFLYAADPNGAVDSNKPIGTAFFVEIPLKSNPQRAYHVLITARHMLDHIWSKCSQQANPDVIYARLNKKDYIQQTDATGVEFVKITLASQGKQTWIHHSNNDVDAAIILLNNPFDRFDVRAIPVTIFPTEDEVKMQSIGDPAMSAGLLPGLPGKSRNYPIFKFGHISNIPLEDVETRCAATDPSFPVKVWLIAANLVPGNSGSPIFHVPLGGFGITLGGTRPLLLGIQSISFMGADVAGMTPIQYVYEILQSMNLPDADLSRGLPQPATPTPK